MTFKPILLASIIFFNFICWLWPRFWIYYVSRDVTCICNQSKNILWSDQANSAKHQPQTHLVLAIISFSWFFNSRAICDDNNVIKLTKLQPKVFSTSSRRARPMYSLCNVNIGMKHTKYWVSVVYSLVFAVICEEYRCFMKLTFRIPK